MREFKSFPEEEVTSAKLHKMKWGKEDGESIEWQTSPGNVHLQEADNPPVLPEEMAMLKDINLRRSHSTKFSLVLFACQIDG